MPDFALFVNRKQVNHGNDFSYFLKFLQEIVQNDIF